MFNIAQIIVKTDDFTLTSTWRCSNGSISSGPSTATKTITFPYVLPAGAELQSAVVYATLGSPNGGINVASVNDVSIQSGTADVTASATATQVKADFKFKAYGRVYSDTATHSGVLGFSDVYLVIEYLVPSSTFTINSTTLEAGVPFVVTIEAQSMDYDHTVGVALGWRNANYWVSAGETSIDITVPLEWLDQITNTAVGQATVSLVTWSVDGEQVGTTASQTLDFYCPAYVVPDPGDLILSAQDLMWGLCVQGHSSVIAQLTGAAGIYGSTIASVSISGGGYTASGSILTTEVLKTAGTNTFVASVTDSRGRTSQATATLAVTAYAPPLIRETTQIRADASGLASNEGTYASVSVSYTYSSIGDNEAVVTVQYRIYGTTAWTHGFSGILPSGSRVIVGSGKLDPEQTYELQIMVTDSFKSASVVRSLGPAAAYVYWDPANSAIGFGCRTSASKTIQIAEDWVLRLGAQSIDELIEGIVSQIETCNCPPIVISATEPETPSAGMIWLDIS